MKQIYLSHQQIIRLLDRPIAFHRCFVNFTHALAPALMLSQALYWQQRTRDPNGWWYKTREEWTEETGMSRWEQESSRRNLRKLKLLYEERRGVPAQLWYKVDEMRLLELLSQHTPIMNLDTVLDGGKLPIQMVEKPPTGRGKNRQQDGGKTSSKMVAPPPTFKGTETTTEITTTTPNPSASKKRSPKTKSARGSCGAEDQNPQPQISNQEPAVATIEAAIEEKTVIQEEAQPAATSTETSGATAESQKTLASEQVIEEQRLELIFPAKLSEAEYADIAAQVYTLPAEIAQQMLDVIDAKIKAAQIKTSPAAVLRGIVRKHRADPNSFDPSMGFAVADARRRRVEAEAQAQAAAEQREREREASRITPETREVAHRSIAHIKQLLRGHA